MPVNWAGNSPAQVNTYYAGADTVGATLKPEQGKSIDFGLVYNPSWLEGVSTSVDFWHIYLGICCADRSAATVVNACFNNNSSPYCSFIHRYGQHQPTAGQVNVINTPVVNLGTLSTSGIDFTLDYKIPHFDLGSFDPGNIQAPASPPPTVHLQGQRHARPAGCERRSTTPAPTALSSATSRAGAARSRSTGHKGNWSAQWQTRYINHLTDLNADAAISGDMPIASVIYHSIQIGYAVPSIHTRFDVGVDNLSDKAAAAGLPER